jgi:rSAM/selenodomain-associated transferase 1
VQLLIVAKEPRPGFAKTRLIPAFGPAGAAALATAALLDTFDAASACAADRVIVAFDGDPAGLVPPAFDVIPQRDGDFGVRLAGAWSDAGGPTLQIGMDTPQVTSAELDAALGQLAEPGTDAVLGLASDGGWWALGLEQAHPGLFDAIPMSTADTGARQLERLDELGLATELLGEHRDVDEPDDVAVAAAVCDPTSRFARVAAGLLAAHRAGATR